MKNFRKVNDGTFKMQLSSYDISESGIVLGGTVSSGSLSIGDTIKVIQQPRKGHYSEGLYQDEEIATLTVKKTQEK